MKQPILLTISLGVLQAALSANAQGTFQNLNFESATLSPLPESEWGTGVEVPATAALPGWTVYIGADPQTQVYQNSYGLGLAQVDIFGPNYTAAGWPPNPFNPGVIDGSYSVFLQSGGEPQNNAIPTSVSIAQTVSLPSGTQSVEFEAWQTYFNQFTVSFNGNTLSPVLIGSGPNYTLYGANIPLSDGSSGQFEFTCDFNGNGPSWIELDDISFSTVSVVPEPSPLVLTGLGGLIFALFGSCWKCKTA